MIDFLKYRYVAAVLSIILISVTIGLYFYKGFEYSVDFTGGTEVLLKFANKVEIDNVKSILKNQGYSGIDAREFSSTELLVRVKEYSSDVQGVGGKIGASLQSAMPNNKVEILKTDGVGAGVGDELRWNSIKVILLALLLMLIYIGIRFKFAFAVGAVVALIHDAIVILLFFLVTNREISLDVIAGILAILGYSNNDTIVIFNRIRQNIKKLSGSSMYDIVNISVNQTLRRTLLTSFSTSLVVLALLIFGGEALRSLSIALMLGIVYGTYSSIYIASPVMLLFYKGEKK